MFNFIKRNSFPFLIALSALSVSASAAFYSVYGLSKLFAGAQFEVIIMAGSLEVAKLVIASLLYQYWDSINKILRTYLSVATVILVIITSMGIYGFLSAAYQDTYQKLIISENKIEFLENKADFYEQDVKRFDLQLEQIMDNISTLSSAKSRSIQIKDTSVVGGVRNTISTAELRLAQNRIEIEENNRKEINLKRTVAADSLQNIKLKILSLENNSETSGELGPLKYLSGLTNTPMDKIINILLLVIIFVFDPLAIALVVAANFAFDKANRKNIYGETEGATLEEQAKYTNWEDYTDEDEKRMDVIGQNGNEGEHYDIEVNEPKEIVPDQTGFQLEDNIVRILQKGPRLWRVLLKDGSQVKVWKEDVKRALNNNLSKKY